MLCGVDDDEKLFTHSSCTTDIRTVEKFRRVSGVERRKGREKCGKLEIWISQFSSASNDVEHIEPLTQH